MQQAVPAQQVVPHMIGAAVGQAQTPALQTWFPVHAWPQLPQLAVLVEVSTQVLEQLTSPVVQHLPRLQVWLALQAVVQVPQCFSSVWRSTQRGLAPAQKDAGAVQLHAPPLHVPGPQLTPQAPQSAASVAVSTQLVPHQVSPVGQQWPALHPSPLGQAAPHAPQFAGSVSVFTQVPPQLVRPVAQHRPALHVSVVGWQALPQAPQLLGSVEVSTQRGFEPGQSVVPPVQVQTPPPQVPGPQAIGQPPQCSGSVWVSTHSGL